MNWHITPSSALAAYACTLIAVLAPMGCSDGLPRRVPVSGKVLIDGEPLTKGNIRFSPELGRPSVAIVGPDGAFKLRCFNDDDGAIVGKHRVTISAKKIHSQTRVEWFAPARYANVETSGLEFDITKPVDDMVIELTWEDKGSRN